METSCSSESRFSISGILGIRKYVKHKEGESRQESCVHIVFTPNTSFIHTNTAFGDGRCANIGKYAEREEKRMFSQTTEILFHSSLFRNTFTTRKMPFFYSFAHRFYHLSLPPPFCVSKLTQERSLQMKLGAICFFFLEQTAFGSPGLTADRCVTGPVLIWDLLGPSPQQEVHLASAGLHPLSQQAPSSSPPQPLISGLLTPPPVHHIRH